MKTPGEWQLNVLGGFTKLPSGGAVPELYFNYTIAGNNTDAINTIVVDSQRNIPLGVRNHRNKSKGMRSMLGRIFFSQLFGGFGRKVYLCSKE